MAIFIVVFNLLIYCYFSHNFTVWRITGKSKTKVRTMYAGAILMLFLSSLICDYVDMQSDLPTAIRFDAILIFTIAIGYFYVAVACMEKHNVLKRKNCSWKKPLRKGTKKSVFAVFLRSHAELLFEAFAEIGRVGKSQSVGDFRNGQVFAIR